MAPKMKSEDQLVETATSIVREYIKAMARLDVNLPSVRVKDIRRRLNRSGYDCYVNVAIIKLQEEGLLQVVPETMDSLVYLKRGGDGAA